MNGYRRRVLVLLALFPLAAPTWLPAQGAPATPAAKPAGPRAHFAAPKFDFGRVSSAELRRHEFVVTNTGTGTLVINAVTPGCGCTSSGQWDREIAPGQTGRIPIEFNPASFSGDVTKSVVVATNDPVQPEHLLEFRAIVWRPFEVSPAYATFLPVEGESRVETKVIRIVHNLEAPATLELPSSTNPQFRAELKTIRPGREFELHVSYDSGLPDRSPNASITVKTSNAEQPALTVSAFALPQPAIVVTPSAIHLPAGLRVPNTSYDVVIRNNSTAALTVSAPVSSVAEISVKLSEPQPGKLFFVNVAIPPGYQPAAGQPAVVTVKTSHPRFPEIRVPILAAPGAAVTAAGK